MNTVFKLMIFSLMLNFATGLMLEAIPQFDENPSTTFGLTYNESLSDGFTSNMENTVTPGSPVQPEENVVYRILDSLNLGFITDFLNAINTYVYGFPILLEKVIGGWLTPGVRTILFGGDVYGIGAFTILITIGYTYAAFSLWTGRNLSE